ncbi:MAG: FtsW/RodA/SpoVE family cell cycle protein [Oscillospiraceae bacterium]|jgi:cell division protein FtsW
MRDLYHKPFYRERRLLILLLLFQLLFVGGFCLQSGGIYTVTWVGDQSYSVSETPVSLVPLVLATLALMALEVVVMIRAIRNSIHIATYLVGVGMLLTFGMVYQSFYSLHSYLLYAVLSIIAMAVMYYLTSRWYPDTDQEGFPREAILMIALIGILMAVNLLFGSTANGARLWVYIGSFSFQPGEFMKVPAVLLSPCCYGTRRRRSMAVVSIVVYTAVIGMLILLRDLGNAVVFFALLVVSIYYLFDSFKLFLALLVAACGGLALVAAVVPYVHARLAAWGQAVVTTDSQLYRTMVAIIKGGIQGLGVDKSGSYLNATRLFAMSCDTAFGGFMAIFGVATSALIVAAVLILVLSPLFTPAVTPFSHLAIVGVSVVLFVQTTLNLGGGADILPFTGINFPFLSSGGSSLLTCGALVGIQLGAMNTSVRVSHPVLQKGGRRFAKKK